MSARPAFYERFLKYVPQLLNNGEFAEQVEKDLGERSAGILDRVRNGVPVEAEDEDDLLDAAWNAYGSCAEQVLTLGWDSNFPGGSGANWLKCCEGVYVITSSDWDTQGPFLSLEEALEEECLNMVTPVPELFSDVLPQQKLLAIARNVVDWENEGTIIINYEKYMVSGDELVPGSEQS